MKPSYNASVIKISTTNTHSMTIDDLYANNFIARNVISISRSVWISSPVPSSHSMLSN